MPAFPYLYVDPQEIQSWPPDAVAAAMAAADLAYADLLEGLAELLITRSPRFVGDLAPYLTSYFHAHNVVRPLGDVEYASLAAMLDDPSTLDWEEFRRVVPTVFTKACTLAVESFVQEKPGWVVKAIDRFPATRRTLLASRRDPGDAAPPG